MPKAGRKDHDDKTELVDLVDQRRFAQQSKFAESIIASMRDEYRILFKSHGIFEMPEFRRACFAVHEDLCTKNVYPPVELIWNAFKQCPLRRLKVVIVLQDPYPQEGVANGLALSVNETCRVPGTLKNFFKKMIQEGVMDPGDLKTRSGDLRNLTRQGILFLNSCLTVREGVSNSHAKIGWVQVTDRMIQILSREIRGLVFILMGKVAQSKEVLLHRSSKVIRTPHPSPNTLAAFFREDVEVFTLCNEILEEQGKAGIAWSL